MRLGGASLPHASSASSISWGVIDGRTLGARVGISPPGSKGACEPSAERNPARRSRSWTGAERSHRANSSAPLALAGSSEVTTYG